MKKVICFLLILILLVAVSVGTFACKSKIESNKEYRMYAYDAKKDSFVKMGATLTFGKDFSTFEYSFADGDLSIHGKVEHTSAPDSYIITCGEEVVSLVTERYKQSMIDGGASDDAVAAYEAIATTFTPRAQYFAYDGKLFTGEGVELFRVAEDDSDAYEGLYRMDSSDDLVRLRGGYAYTADENGEYTYKNGRYSVSRGILTLISLDEKGKDRYQNGVLMRKRYLMAKVTIPADGELVDTDLEEQLETSAFVSKILDNKTAYAGKTIAVLCDKFLSTKMK